MNVRMKLLATAAISSLLASGAYAAPVKKHHVAHRAPAANAELLQEVRALRAQVEELRAKVDTTSTAQASVQAEVQATQSQVQAVQTQVASAPPPVTKEVVGTQIASAIEKEHHNDKLYFKGITLTPGGFLELAGIYRDHFQGNDISSSFSIPFPNNRQAHVSEGRFSARQSRVSFLAQGKPNADTTLSMYGEFDFQGAAQTSNSNQSNSFVPRIRNLYGTIDWNTSSGMGLHLLAGQNWSLVTLQGKGISPRSEVTPPQIDAQYVPGFAWARQPGIRLTADFMDHQLWAAVSVENPQTTFAGTVPATVTNNATGGSGFDANNLNQLSLNHIPDVIGKVAYDAPVSGHNVHLESFGIVRTFSAHFNGTQDNNNKSTVGYGASANIQVVPKILDAQFSYFGGKGIGRYGSAGLPDVTFDANGGIHPIKETMLLGGLTLHATKMLDIYGFAGEEFEKRNILGGGYGVGLLTANNAGCFIEGGTCAGNTRRIRQLTGGFWDKIYQGPFGRAQVGIQYSYTQRELFDGVGGEPQTSNSIGFLSFRYYPF